MRNLLAFLAALTLTVLGLGWYLDWYHVRTSPGPSAGHRNVTIDIDTVKFEDDLSKGGAKIQEMLEKNRKDQAAKEKEAAGKDSVPEPVRPASHQDGKAPEEKKEHKGEGDGPPAHNLSGR
jgi:hypothetical protein